MQIESSDSRLPEPIPGNLGKSGSLSTEVLGKFAQSMAENIIQSTVKLEPLVSCSNKSLELLAEEIASTIIEVALMEVCSPQSIEDRIRGSTSAWVKTIPEEGQNSSFVDKSGEEEDLLDTEMEPVKEMQISKDPQSFHPPLFQSGLPIVGSLDYPDAPPTTPLSPELERSRHSFARKLKGGLAKVFLPSPPPPTPKDNSDPQEGLMEHLMHSLSSNGLGADGLEAGHQQGANLEAFAEDLSCDIMNWVWNVKSGRQITDESDLHLLAHQLAESIITSSIDKAKMPI